MRYVSVLALAAGVALSAPANAADEPCANLLPRASPLSVGKHTVSPADLVTLRDIGPVDPEDRRAPILTLSPDRSQIAFQVRQASVETNRYCLGMVIMKLTAGAAPQLVDAGGDYLKVTYVTTGFAEYTSPGAAAVIEPKWSPDGIWIAFLRRDQGRTQLWRARADGTLSQPMTDVPFDVEQFAWLPDSDSLVLAGRPQLKAAEAALVQEGRGGYLFDDRYVPVVSSKPLVREPIDTAYFVVGGPDQATRVAKPSEIESLVPQPKPDFPAGAQMTVSGRTDAVAWTQRPDGDTDLITAPELRVRTAAGVSTCSTCTDVLDMWWSDDDQIVFQRRESQPHGRIGLYTWRPGVSSPRRILATDDVLIGCQLSGGELICGREGAIQPRRIVAIDLKSGRDRLVFDPNPDAQAWRLGPVERLYWTNAFGKETHGDLVLPPDHKPGDRHPLIVVQYLSRGFLRGGTGNEYPIQAFAARGYAVLSFQSPSSVGLVKGVKSWDEVNRRDRIEWADRRSIQSSLEMGVKILVDRGLVDPTRIGLTGLSDGSSTAQFELVNSRLFSAAAVGTCCDEPIIVNQLDGPVVGGFFHQMGYPTLMAPDDKFWAAVSFHMNAAKIETPLLMQLPDREYLGALETYTALKELNKPVEMYVFPDEYHIKWQPEHQLAGYQRTLDWFDFWLLGKEDPDASKASQYARWRELRQTRSARLSATPAP